MPSRRVIVGQLTVRPMECSLVQRRWLPRALCGYFWNRTRSNEICHLIIGDRSFCARDGLFWAYCTASSVGGGQSRGQTAVKYIVKA